MMSITAYACSTSDGCTNCYPEAAATACRNSLNSQTQQQVKDQVKDKCAGMSGSAYEQCKSGVTNANKGGTGTNSNPNTNTNNGGGSGNNGGGGSTTTTTPDNTALCAICNSYNSDDANDPTDETKSQCQAAGCPIQEKQKSNGVITNSGTKYKDFDGNTDNLTGCERVFGSYSDGKFTDKKSLGYFLQMTFNIIKYIVPIILIVLTLVDFLKAIASSDKEIIKVATGKLTKRTIIALVIFLIPTILNLILGLVTTHGTCGIK